ncbi:hypothetical protein PEC302110_04750 [Pectobacterium araliae]|uniref:Uncharacterized protein n=1 Tax=Pectobacterium araliae TaxID=3073862 RepID=A0AAN0KGC6_9GAMM|nr:hypothetical protein PEC302110_04750 [Pectobacterium sp. MAFF 302110]
MEQMAKRGLAQTLACGGEYAGCEILIAFISLKNEIDIVFRYKKSRVRKLTLDCLLLAGSFK